MKTTTMVFTALCFLFFPACGESGNAHKSTVESTASVISLKEGTDSGKVVKTDEEWRKILTEEQYYILREKGTERPFTGKYANNHEHGIYRCAACGNELFSSDTKFESGTGWPSFWQPLTKRSVDVQTDSSLGMTRDEVTCSRCGGHLGHVFNDGPEPTGLRYCMNSAAMDFQKQ